MNLAQKLSDCDRWLENPAGGLSQ